MTAAGLLCGGQLSADPYLAVTPIVGARAVGFVDVDGDGHQDIVATRTDERPRWLRGDIWMS